MPSIQELRLSHRMMAQPIFMERLTVFQPKKSLSHNTIIIEIFRCNISSIIPEDSLV